MSAVIIEGMLLQASLIFALGPQNLFILESGLRRHHHFAVSFVCFLCDLTLIMLGVAGAATFFSQYPQIKIIFGILGVAFLLMYGFGKIRSVNLLMMNDGQKNSDSLQSSVLKAITFSVVNPHAYLDGIVLIGGYSAKYSDLSTRIALGMGASFYSLFWFLLLSCAASSIMPFFKSPRLMKLMMGGAGMILLFLSFRLSVDVYQWVVEAYPSLAMKP